MSDLVPPHSIEAEQAMLGAIFLDNNVLDDVTRIIQDPIQLYRAAHQHIYEAMLALRDRGAVLDWVTVGEELKRGELLADCGGDAYLEELTGNTPMSEGVEQYAEIVREKSVLRAVDAILKKQREKSFDATTDAGELLSETIKRLQSAQSGWATSASACDDTEEAVEWFRSLADPNGDQTVFCGHPVIDDQAMGFNLGGLSQFIAPSGSGKTFFLHQLCMRIKRESGIECAMIQGEMKGARLLVRQATGRKAMMAAHAIRKGSATQADKRDFEAGIERIERLGATMYKVYTPKSMSLDHVSESIREAASRGAKFVVVDYLQRIYGKRRDANSDLTAIVGALKDLARNLDIHICCASQLHMLAARDKDKSAWELTQWDAYGGAAAVNDFDLIATVFRPGTLPGNKGEAIRHACTTWPIRADQITVVGVKKSRFGDKEVWGFWVGVQGEEDLTIEPMSDEMSTAFSKICQLGEIDNE